MDFGDFSVGSESIKTIKTIGGSCGGEDVTIGGAYSQGITAELSQTPCDLEGRAFQLYICLIDLSDDTQENGEESELIPMGRFFAASCKKRRTEAIYWRRRIILRWRILNTAQSFRTPPVQRLSRKKYALSWA